MLSNKSVEMAKILVANESAVITPRQNSILEEAVMASVPLMQTATPSLESFAQEMIVASNREHDGYEMHDGAISEVVGVVGPALVRQINYVRKTVVPFIGEVSSELLTAVNGAEPIEYEIVPVGIGDLPTVPVVAELFAKMTTPMAFASLIKCAPEKTDAELINGLKTGLPELDDVLAATVAKYGANSVVGMYDAFFRGRFNQGTDETSRAIHGMVVKIPDGKYRMQLTNPRFVDLAIVGYFLIDSFVDNVIPGTGLSLDQYNNVIRAMKLSMGQQINFLVKNFSQDIQRGRLVISWAEARGLVFEAHKARILVNEIVYTNAQAQGVTPEVIIGAMLDPRGAKMDLPSIVANSKFYLGLWERLDASRNEHILKGFHNRLKHVIGPVLQAKLDALPDDYLPNGYDRTAVVKNIIDNLSTNGMNSYGDWEMDGVPNLFQLAKGIAVTSVFNFIDTASIIETIEGDLDDGEAKPEYAAYRAAVKHLAKWLVGQFNVTTAVAE